MVYDILTFSIAAGGTRDALKILEETLQVGTSSTLSACWHCEIGSVGDVLAIRSYAEVSQLQSEREQAVLDGESFGLDKILTGISRQTFVSFPFLGEIVAGNLGPYYEVRVYEPTGNGIVPTMKLWKEALPHRTSISPLLTAMYALDGSLPRIMHIWPYPSLDARQLLRAQAFASGQWPPAGGLAYLRKFSSSIYLPADFSPLR